MTSPSICSACGLSPERSSGCMSQRPDCLMRLRHQSTGPHRTALALDGVGADLRAGLDALARARGRLADVVAELPERLVGIRVGDQVVVGEAPLGTLVVIQQPDRVHPDVILHLDDGWWVALTEGEWSRPACFAAEWMMGTALSRKGHVLALGLTALHLPHLPRIAEALRLPHLPELPAARKESP